MYTVYKYNGLMSDQGQPVMEPVAQFPAYVIAEEFAKLSKFVGYSIVVNVIIKEEGIPQPQAPLTTSWR